MRVVEAQPGRAVDEGETPLISMAVAIFVMLGLAVLMWTAYEGLFSGFQG